MRNELLLAANLLLVYGGVLLFYKLFGKTGLYGWTVLATLAANIEVLILVEAFGMEQTLGNILFASNFLVTDILSEKYGKKEAGRAVNLGVAASFAFLLISQFWLLYTPAEADWASPHIVAVFKNTPRLMLVSFLVYIICQKFDVWLYHRLWAYTARKTGDTDRFLWLRNNAATMLSQLVNAVAYTFGAFWGMYPLDTLISICLSTYVIYFVTSLADTPFVYLARRIQGSGEHEGEL